MEHGAMVDLPGAILTIALRAYWIGVFTMLFCVRQVGRVRVGLVPHQPLERLIWLMWVPLIFAWVVLVDLARPVGIRLAALEGTRGHPLIAVPPMALAQPALATARWIASMCSVGCLLGTVACWRRMGRNWRLSVLPDQRTELVTGGLYARTRHPIYALNILLMICSIIVVPTVPMVAVGAVHVGLILLKARNEERFLLQVHGQRYAEYCRRTGGFFPRLGSRGS
jgi:protein-S-isoprenylcysteine O-methyltransferase Ste14